MSKKVSNTSITVFQTMEEVQMQSQSQSNSSVRIVFNCSPQTNPNRITVPAIRSTTSNDDSLLAKSTRNSCTTEKCPLPTITGNTPFQTRTLSSAFMDLNVKKIESDTKKNVLIEPSGRKADADMSVIPSSTSCCAPQDKDINAEQAQQDEYDDGKTSFDSNQKTSNETNSSHNSKVFTLLYHTPFALDEFQSIENDSIFGKINHEESKSDFEGFFLSLPTRPHEYYIDDTCESPSSCDSYCSSKTTMTTTTTAPSSPFPTLRDSKNSNADDQIQSPSSILTRRIQKSMIMLNSPKMRYGYLKYMRPRSSRLEEL